jgi:hypothetical protein
MRPANVGARGRAPLAQRFQVAALRQVQNYCSQAVDATKL